MATITKTYNLEKYSLNSTWTASGIQEETHGAYYFVTHTSAGTNSGNIVLDCSDIPANAVITGATFQCDYTSGKNGGNYTSTNAYVMGTTTINGVRIQSSHFSVDILNLLQNSSSYAAVNIPITARANVNSGTQHSEVLGGDLLYYGYASSGGASGSATQSAFFKVYNIVITIIYESTEEGNEIYYGINGSWKKCEGYYGTNGVWKKIAARYGSGGSWGE